MMRVAPGAACLTLVMSIGCPIDNPSEPKPPAIAIASFKTPFRPNAWERAQYQATPDVVRRTFPPRWHIGDRWVIARRLQMDLYSLGLEWRLRSWELVVVKLPDAKGDYFEVAEADPGSKEATAIFRFRRQPFSVSEILQSLSPPFEFQARPFTCTSVWTGWPPGPLGQHF